VKDARIRPIAICVPRRQDEILVFSVPHPSGLTGYRPLGGGIEFGEQAIDALHRELREELGTALLNVELVTTTENIFTFEGERGHEIVFIYQADLADTSLYEIDEFTCREDNGETFTALWKRLSEFGSGAPLYPDGLQEILSQRWSIAIPG
jgi:ADP-ribose pyrophosphatase YjhB (NUDIX family)